MKDPDGTMRAEVPVGNRRVDAMASGCVAKGSGSCNVEEAQNPRN